MEDDQWAVTSNPTRAGGPIRQITMWWSRLLDGERVWGRVDFGLGNRGFKKLRIVVLPPGVSKIDRRYVRLARSWPTWGVMLWLTTAILIGSLHLPMTAHAYTTTVILGVGAAAFALAGNARSQVRTVSAVLIAGYDDRAAAARYAELERLAKALWAADTMRDSGDMSIVDHEFVWWQVYQSLATLAPNADDA